MGILGQGYSGDQIQPGTLPIDAITAAFAAYLAQNAVTATAGVDGDTITFTSNWTVITSSTSRSYTSIVGVSPRIPYLFEYVGSGTIDFDSCANVIYKEPLVKTSNRYMLLIINVGTLISPQWMIFNKTQLTGAAIETILDAYYGNTDWRTGGAGGGLSMSRTYITPTEVLAMNATPKNCVSAPGATLVNDPIEALVFLNFNTTAYTTNTTLELLSGSTVIATCNCLAGTAAGFYKFTFNGNAPEFNGALTVRTQTGEALAGNSEIVIILGVQQLNKANFNLPLPTASSVSFTGTQTVGNQLSGSYTYDPSFPQEGATTFQWYRADDSGFTTNVTAISGATSINYTLAASESGKYVRLGVTPVNQNGTGSEVFSAASGQIGAGGTTKTVLINFYSVTPITNPVTIGATDYYYNNVANIAATGTNLITSPVDSDNGAVSVNLDVVDAAYQMTVDSSITVDTDSLLNSNLGDEGARFHITNDNQCILRLTGLNANTSYQIDAAGRRVGYDSVLQISSGAQSDTWIMGDGNTDYGTITVDSDGSGEILLTFISSQPGIDTNAYLCGLRITGVMS